ncbi:MAG TPA: hypothetical protein VFG04_17840 [Planctomycetaceae bacterium]|jgi:hypothetical protein|nr:hypothetical protein [Planctomycetaceae bacterium]
MPDPVLILGATAAAAIVAALVMLAGAWPARRDWSGWATLAEVAAVGGGMGIGCWWLNLLPKFPPIEDQDRLLLVLLPAVGIVEILAAALRRWPWFGRVFRVLLALVTPTLLLLGSGYLPGSDPSVPSTWTKQEALEILLGLGVLLAFLWGLLIYLAQKPGGFVVPAALGLITAAAGVSLMLSGYASGGEVGLPFAGVAAAALLVCLLLARERSMTGLVGIGTVLLFGLLMAGRFFGELTTMNFALLIAAPMLCALVALPPVRTLKAPVRFVAALIICLLPAGVAVGLAVHAFPWEGDESSGYAGTTSGGDAPAYGAGTTSPQTSSEARPSGSAASFPEPPTTSGSPRDPGADEPASTATKQKAAPVDPGEELKR